MRDAAALDEGEVIACETSSSAFFGHSTLTVGSSIATLPRNDRPLLRVLRPEHHDRTSRRIRVGRLELWRSQEAAGVDFDARHLRRFNVLIERRVGIAAH